MFKGSLVALITPMSADGSIDYACLQRLIDWHIEEGTTGLVIAGTTGESATLSTHEHVKLIQRCAEFVAGRIPVIAGTGSNSTRQTIELSAEVHATQIDAYLMVTPYYNKPTQEGLYRHYKTVADTVPVAQILYNVPGRTAVDMLPDTVERLADIDNIVGLKEATGDMNRAREILDRCGDRLDLYSGDDATAMELILLGGQGNISVTANVAPAAMHELCAAALAGDRDTAAAINGRVEMLHRALFIESNPIPVKWALYEMGLIPAGIRLPLTPLASQYQDTVRQALAQAGVIEQ